MTPSQNIARCLGESQDSASIVSSGHVSNGALFVLWGNFWKTFIACFHIGNLVDPGALCSIHPALLFISEHAVAGSQRPRLTLLLHTSINATTSRRLNDSFFCSMGCFRAILNTSSSNSALMLVIFFISAKKARSEYPSLRLATFFAVQV